MINRNWGRPQPINSSYSTRNNTTKNINFSADRIGIAAKFIDFMPNYPRVRAIKVKPKSKEPLELNWQKINNYSVKSTHVLNHLMNGGNWGLVHPSGMSCAIDGDIPEIRAAALSLGNTLEWNTGTPGHYCELFLIKDEPVGNIPLKDGAYIRGKGGQNLGPGSIHPNGNIYGDIYLHLVPPLEVTKAELLDSLNPFIEGKEKIAKNYSKPDYQNQLNPNFLTMKDLVDVTGFKQNGSKFQGPHPIHGSTTGTNFVVDLTSNQWICFRHDTGGGPLQWIAVSTGVIACEESTPGKVKGDIFWRTIAAAHDTYSLSYKQLVAALGGKENGK
ncbi:bifunctional DNA primase/polymerase [Ferroplasma acidiphilum]|uniref:DNA primase/polymerase bifunctional N-terminal domain-containing protein n=1 Tax=Ferroplasma acidiphilum TaxID=74969 RepID=A0A7K4FP99_9ARCH|nr:bifunctional DNA primase/polymerase [Ferroplasma acidiphilum]NOL60846.1 hypothetical protein [Ferroplasma acidiphilum]